MNIHRGLTNLLVAAALGSASPLAAQSSQCFATEPIPAIQNEYIAVGTVGDALNDHTKQFVAASTADAIVRIVRVLPGSGSQVLKEIPLPPAAPPQWIFASVVVADFDGDGKNDIGVYYRANNYHGTLYTLLFRESPSGPTWEMHSFTTPESDAGYNLAVADFDGDGKADIVTLDIGYLTPARVYVTFNDGMQFTRTVPLDMPVRAVKTFIGDVDKDGRPDIGVATHHASPVAARIFRNVGNGAFTIYADLYSGDGSVCQDIAFGDVDGNGSVDIVTNSSIPNGYTQHLMLYRQVNGVFQPPVVLTAGNDPRSPVIADFNGDGYADIATDNALDRTVSVFFGSAGGFDTPPVTIASSVLSAGHHCFGGVCEVLSVGDLDGDGLPELVSCVENAVLIRNPCGVTSLTACPPSGKVNVRFHYSANGSSGSWSGTKSTNCADGSVMIGPQAMAGDLKLAPGAMLRTGYSFTLPGNKLPFRATATDASVVFQLRCVSGVAPSLSSLTVPITTAQYSVVGSEWVPTGDQNSVLVYQGSITVPDVCNGGLVRFNQGGTFSATIMLSGH